MRLSDTPCMRTASFGDMAPPRDTSFNLYAHTKATRSSASTSTGEATLHTPMVLAGETSSMVYAGTNWMSKAAGPSNDVEERRLARDYSGE